jgi:hypothetical protein
VWHRAGVRARAVFCHVVSGIATGGRCEVKLTIEINEETGDAVIVAVDGRCLLPKRGK